MTWAFEEKDLEKYLKKSSQVTGTGLWTSVKAPIGEHLSAAQGPVIHRCLGMVQLWAQVGQSPGMGLTWHCEVSSMILKDQYGKWKEPHLVIFHLVLKGVSSAWFSSLNIIIDINLTKATVFPCYFSHWQPTSTVPEKLRSQTMTILSLEPGGDREMSKRESDLQVSKAVTTGLGGTCRFALSLTWMKEHLHLCPPDVHWCLDNTADT